MIRVYGIGMFLTLVLFAACRPEPVQESPPPPRPRKIIAFGDQFTAGSGLEYRQSYPSYLRHWIDSAGLRHLQVVNAGLRSETTATADARVEWLLQQGGDTYVLTLGHNDRAAGLDAQQSLHHLRSIVEKIRRAVPEATIYYWPSGTGPAFDNEQVEALGLLPLRSMAAVLGADRLRSVDSLPYEDGYVQLVREVLLPALELTADQ